MWSDGVQENAVHHLSMVAGIVHGKDTRFFLQSRKKLEDSDVLKEIPQNALTRAGVRCIPGIPVKNTGETGKTSPWCVWHAGEFSAKWKNHQKLRRNHCFVI